MVHVRCTLYIATVSVCIYMALFALSVYYFFVNIPYLLSMHILVSLAITHDSPSLFPSECVWNEEDELNIELFCELLQQRCPSKDALTTKSVIRCSFPDIFPEDDSSFWISRDSPELPEVSHGVAPSDTSSRSSIMEKVNSSVVVLRALKRQLKEVDDNGDGKVDWQEFNEVLFSLKSSLHGVKASKLFYRMADVVTHELSITRFMADIKAEYKLHPDLSGDEAIERVSHKYKRHHRRGQSFTSTTSGGTMSSYGNATISVSNTISVSQNTASNAVTHNITPLPSTVTSPHFPAFSPQVLSPHVSASVMMDIGSISEDTESQKLDNFYHCADGRIVPMHPSTVIQKVQQILNLCDQDGDGRISKNEFTLFLSKFNEIDLHFNAHQLHLIYMQLTGVRVHMDSEDESVQQRASCHILMHRVHQIHAERPRYSAQRVVMSVCRRLLKMAMKGREDMNGNGNDDRKDRMVHFDNVSMTPSEAESTKSGSVVTTR